MAFKGFGHTAASLTLALALALCVAPAVSAQKTDLAITLTTKPSPLGLGQNWFEASVKDAKGNPLAGANVMVEIVMPPNPATKHPEMRSGGLLKATTPGIYRGIILVTMAGNWTATVTVKRDGKEIGRSKNAFTAVERR
jgi:YtkA-like